MKRLAGIYFLCFSLLLGSIACQKDEILHENLVVTGNQAPPHDGINTIQIQSYVNKVYIDLKGEEPELDTLNYITNYLKSKNLAQDARDSLVNALMGTPEYYEELFERTSQTMLNGLGKEAIASAILENEFIIDFYYSIGDTLNAQVVEYLNGLLLLLYGADSDLRDGTASINDFYARFCYNSVFDEINMGSQNFVVACFENLFNRYPTVQELENGIRMVNGESSFLMLLDGNSKVDFVQIVTSVQEFYSGLVADNFQLLLQRPPTSEELTNLSIALSETQSLQELQKTIVTSDEYAGF